MPYYVTCFVDYGFRVAVVIYVGVPGCLGLKLFGNSDGGPGHPGHIQ